MDICSGACGGYIVEMKLSETTRNAEDASAISSRVAFAMLESDTLGAESEERMSLNIRR